MGVPTGGQSLGTATGRIVIDTAGVRQAQAEVQASSKLMNEALGAIGISLTAAGFVQLAKAAATFAIQSSAIATSFARQSVAARELAGGQGQLNDLLEVYNAATGGAIDNATALADVTRLLAVGFADSTEELDQFARAARGIAVATGQSQDYIIGQLQLAIANQSTMRLDQLGLGVSEVKQRIDELKASNRGLTDEMAYQQAILEAANDKFGALVDSTEAQATSAERLAVAWKNMRLEIGQEIKPNVEETSNALLDLLNLINRVRDANKEFQRDAVSRRALEEGRPDPFGSIGSRTSIGRVTPQAFGEGVAPNDAALSERNAAIVEWHRETIDIERQAARDRIDATRQFEEQRTTTIRDYERTIAREAQDFAIQRARAEEDYALNLQRMHRDIAQREARQFEELERTISDARRDAAERGAERQAALDERIAETRSQANERIAELEADFSKRRERAQRDHAERLRDAAANLDAVAVREAQRDFRNSQRDAQEDFDDRLEKERANEAKRLEELNKAHAKQGADEAKALQRRIDDANKAHQRQLEDARAADEQRLADMSADFALRQERENEDRAIRLERLAEDHQAQLEEQARQHELRMIQIAEQEADELREHNEAFDEQMAELAIYHDGVLERQTAFQNESLQMYEAYLEAQRKALQAAIQGPLTSPWNGPVFSGGVAPVSSSSVTNSSSRSLSLAPGAIVINGDGLNEQQVAAVVIEKLADFFEG